jgi:hypothetical protein
MDQKINAALLLLTCDRPDETKRTIDSLLKHVDLSRFILLHGDDASMTNKNCKEAWRAGFKTVVRPSKRQGVSKMWQQLIEKAAGLGVDWIITQENDWEWVKDFPFDVFEEAQAREDIYYVRFFGEYKEQGCRRPCGVTHSGKRITPVWQPFRQGWQIGDIHWGFPGNATRIEEAVFLTKGITRENDCRERSGKINKLCVRPIENYLYHIGEHRTGGFRA